MARPTRIRIWQPWPSNCIEHNWIATSNSTLNEKRICTACGMPNWRDFVENGVIYQEVRR